MPKCPECGCEFEEAELKGNKIDYGVIQTERKIIVKLVSKGQAVGCLYCLDCKKFGWGENRCRRCSSTNVALFSKRCAVEDYKRAVEVT